MMSSLHPTGAYDYVMRFIFGTLPRIFTHAGDHQGPGASRWYTDHPRRRREASEHRERDDDMGILWMADSESAARNIQEQGDQETASDVALGGAVSYFNFQHDITTKIFVFSNNLVVMPGSRCTEDQ